MRHDASPTLTTLGAAVTSAITLAIASGTSPANASGVIFSDNFDDGNGATRWSAPIFSTELNPEVIDGDVDYALDYSAFTFAGGVPTAPGGGNSIGLGIRVNNTDQPADEGEAIGVSPLLGSALGNHYRLRGQAFIYYQGGTGSSEHAILAVNNDGSNVPFLYDQAGTGQTYAIPHNSGLTNTVGDDYSRIDDAVLTDLYGNGPSPADPDTLNIPFKGNDPVFNDAGYPGNRWFNFTLAVKPGNQVTLKIENVIIDQYDASGSTSTGDLLIGAADLFNSANSTNWVIYDNIIVETVPTPTAGLTGIGLMGFALGRQRRRR